MGIIERPNIVRESMRSKGVATAANKKSNAKFCQEKQTESPQNLQAGMVLSMGPTRCGPVGGSVEACGKMAV